MCPPSMTLPRVHAGHRHICPKSILLNFMLAYHIYVHIKLFFFHACIEMDSSEVIYLSSDDESPFERNQRLLKEHHEEEDRRQVQSHLTRVLDEVKEGKRKFLRIAALPEPSSIPVATPLDKTLVVTIAYEPGELRFDIMSQQSQTGSRSPPPVVEAESAPFGVLLYQSPITDITQI